MSCVVRAEMDADGFIKQLSAVDPNFNKKKFMQKFSSLNTDIDRVSFAYDILKRFNLLPLLVHSKKNNAEAEKIRVAGNEDFRKGDLSSALSKYTNALLYSESDVEMARIYGNRSACLFRLKMRQECLVDIDRAVSLGYPVKLKPKLMERRDSALKMPDEKHPHHSGIPYFDPSLANSKIQCAKNCIEIKQNSTFGRYIEAIRDIQIGEVLSVEKPFVATVCNDEKNHCHHCLIRCYNPIPCKTCVLLVFCSKECLEEAQSYHKYECRILASLLRSGVAQNQLPAIRVSLMIRNNLLSLDSLNVHEGDVYRSDRYKELHYLTTGVDKRPKDHLLFLSFVSAIFFHFLSEYTDYFEGPDSSTMKTIFKGIALQHLQAVDINGIFIQQDGERPLRLRNTFGFGLYSFSSLYNHSCNSNVVTIQYDSTMVVRAVRTIRKGEQCCVSYGIDWVAPKLVRLKFLQANYFFHCHCNACTNNLGSFGGTNLATYFNDDIDFMALMFHPSLLLGEGNDGVGDLLPRVINAMEGFERRESLGNIYRMKELIIDLFLRYGNRI